MKKLATTFLCSMILLGSQAAGLPEAKVRALPSEYGWFDSFAVVWAENPTEPYSLQIVDDSGIEVTMNLMEDVEVLAVQTVEYQQDENTPVYMNSQLVVYLADPQMAIGSYYTLTIPAGAVMVAVSETESVPNEEVTYSFTLQENEQVGLPDPEIVPAPGVVESLSKIEISWPGVLGDPDLLNFNSDFDGDGVQPVSLTIDGEPAAAPEVSFDWSSRTAVTPGSAGDILVLTIPETSEPGEYEITIAKDYLQVTDIETGTLYNDEIVISYTITDLTDKVNSISISGGEIRVFDLNGKSVNSSDLKALPKGVYIINGKKIRI